MRSLAFFSWVCLVLASSPTLGQGTTFVAPEAYLGPSDVYDFWCENLSNYDYPLDSWCVSNDTASELYDIQQTGLGVLFVVARTNLLLESELIVSNNLCWLAGYPVYPGDFPFPSPEDFLYYVTNGSTLVRSVIDSLAQLNPLLNTNLQNFTASYVYTNDFSLQPYGRVLRTGVRLRLVNPYIGFYCAFVSRVPTVWSDSTLYAVTPSTFEEITRLPWQFPPAAIWLGDNPSVTVRLKERWK